MKLTPFSRFPSAPAIELWKGALQFLVELELGWQLNNINYFPLARECSLKPKKLPSAGTSNEFRHFSTDDAHE